MTYLIKIILICFFSLNTIAKQSENNKVIFEIDNKVFTKIDLERRIKYIELANNLKFSELKTQQKIDIQQDYVSSLIFNKYFLEKNIKFNNLNDELNIIFEQYIENNEFLKKEEIQYFKQNIKIDLIRKKILEDIINSKRDDLLKTANDLDLLYNYNVNYIILKNNEISINSVNDINNREEFNTFRDFLEKNKIKYFYKNENIDDYSLASKKLRDIIKKDIRIFFEEKNNYITLISLEKNLESYEGIFVKLINYTSNVKLEKRYLNCDEFENTEENTKTVYKEYEYSKLNDKVKNNLKSVNDYMLISNDEKFNYIFLCELKYDQEILNTINFNKKLNSLVKKIENKFLNKYKNEYGFKKI